MVLEVDAVAGFEPYPSVGGELVAGLEPLLDKPGGIEVVMDGSIASRGTDHAWTDRELADLAPAHFDLEVPPGTVKMHVMFVDGHHARDDEQDGRVLGLAWAHTHIVLFKGTLEESCSGGTLGPLFRERLCTNAELAVWTHEVGHNLGLVDNGLPMVTDHRDPDHGRHDVNDGCVMYWAYEGTAVVDLLRTRLTGGNEQALGFDPECMADVAALRNR